MKYPSVSSNHRCRGYISCYERCLQTCRGPGISGCRRDLIHLAKLVETLPDLSKIPMLEYRGK